MAYVKQNLANGDTLEDNHINHIEDGIASISGNRINLSAVDFINGTYSGTSLISTSTNRIRTNWIEAKKGTKCCMELQESWLGYIAIEDPETFVVATDWSQRFEYEFSSACRFIIVLKEENDATITPANYTSTVYVTHPSSLKDTGYEVKDYYLSEIETTIASVKECLTEPCLVFPMVSDIHYLHAPEQPTSIDFCVNNMRALAEELTFNFVTCLGDMIEGDTPQKESFVRADHVLDKFKSIGIPFYPTIGNHDDNRYESGATFNQEQLRRAYLRHTYDVSYDPSVSMKGTSYYKDFEELGLRCFFLTSNTNGAYGYSDDTCTWFETAVTNCPHRFLVFTHISPVPAQNYGQKYGTDTGSTRIRTACINSDKFIMLFSGHNHYDASFIEPFLSFTMNCQKFELTNGDASLWAEGAVKPTRVVGEASEDCFDIVVVRPTSKKINRIRFGAGDDQEYTYE